MIVKMLFLFISFLFLFFINTRTVLAAKKVNYQNAYLKWDGKTSDKDFTGDTFAALTKTTVYRSEKSPTGFYVTFRYYAPEAKRVQISGDWLFSEKHLSTANKAPRIHPNNWYNGCILHTCTRPHALRPVDDMVLNKETGYWFFTIPLPSGWFTYQFFINGEDEVNWNNRVTDPQNPPAEYKPGVENYSIVLLPYDPVKQSKSPDYSYNGLLDECEQMGDFVFDCVPSKILGWDAPVGIYTPNGYNPNKKDGYKYLIIMHGMGGFATNWISQNCMGNITDNLIARRETEPLIVIMPEMNKSNGEWAYRYINYDGSLINKPNVEGKVSEAVPYIVNELIPWVEKNYNVSNIPENRALAGLSRGGETTFSTYLAYPEKFAYFYCMSHGYKEPDVFNYDYSRKELKKPTLAFGFGLFDFGFFDGGAEITMRVLSDAGIDFTTNYALGGHRPDVWRDCYIDLLRRVLWK